MAAAFSNPEPSAVDHGEEWMIKTFPKVQHRICNIDIISFAQINGRTHEHFTNVVGFKCECSREYFCPNVIQELKTALPKIRKNSTRTEFALPVFGSVLHRISVSRTVMRDWEGNETKMYAIMPNVIPGVDDEIFVNQNEPPEKVYNNNLLHIRNEVVKQFKANPIAQSLLAGGINDIITHSGQTCQARKHSGFGAQRLMVESADLSRDSGDQHYVNQLWAMLFTSLNYGYCFACARGRDPAFWFENE